MPSSCRQRRKWSDSARPGSGSAVAGFCDCARVRLTLASSRFSSVWFAFISIIIDCLIGWLAEAARGDRRMREAVREGCPLGVNLHEGCCGVITARGWCFARVRVK